MGNYEARDKKRNKRAYERDDRRFYSENKGKKSRTKVQEERREIDNFAKDLEKVFADKGED